MQCQLLIPIFRIILILSFLLGVCRCRLGNIHASTTTSQDQNVAVAAATPGSFAHSRCRYGKDDITHGGILVDCQGRGLQSPPRSAQLPSGTTTLLLQNNAIRRLEKDAFVAVPDLKRLDLSNNNLQYIHPSTFRSIGRLIFLNLESNSLCLDDNSFPGEAFNNLHDLAVLRLARNANDELWCGSHYSPNLLQGLTNLRTLTFDTFTGKLDFGRIFSNAKNLSSLTISGGLTKISHESFQTFEFIKLKTLEIAVDNLYETEQGAYRYLTYLESFSLKHGSQGLNKTLESLAPLAHQNLTSLRLHGINHRVGMFSSCGVNNVLSSHNMRFLTQICVSHLALTSNKILYIEHGALTSDVWSKCLLSIDISSNPLLGDDLVLFSINQLHSLQSFRYINRKFSLISRGNAISESSDSLTCRSRTNERPIMNTLSNMKRGGHTTTCIKSPESQTKKNVSNTFQKSNSTWAHTKEINNLLTVSIRVPKSLTYLNINQFSSHMGPLDVNYNISGGENLLELHVSDCGLRAFTGRLHGIKNLQLIDFSKNNGSEFSKMILDQSPRLLRLNMSGMNLDNDWLLRDGEEFFNKFPELASIDLSNNDLHFLSERMLSGNGKLRAIGLARNRFKAIPIDNIISLFPNLCLLDLSTNSILQLDDNDMDMLDAHARRMETFTLLLKGNVFSCGCSSLRFLSWLQTTSLRIDDDSRNYSCILESGNITTTYQMRDINALWRKCFGKIAFLMSLIIACLMALGYCMMAVWMKFETQLRAYLIMYLGRRIPMKKPIDYTYGVYLGYSDRESTLACVHLRNYIENDLGLSTYLRHRDLLPASDMAESIVSAINSSWRVVLVVTDSYLQDPWSFLAIKTAIYSVHAANPHRVAVVVTSDKVLRHNCLTSMLTVVREENILHLTSISSSEGLDKDEQNELKCALLP